MKKIFNLILLILLFTNSYSQQNASLLYNWQDSSLVGSWAYDNIYNECWGVYINDHEIAIIGSSGFVGKNLSKFLEQNNKIKIFNLSSYNKYKSSWQNRILREIKILAMTTPELDI